MYGRNGFGYIGTNGNIMAVRNRDTMQWEVIAQVSHDAFPCLQQISFMSLKSL